MNSNDDMNTPVTRRELREELQQLEQRLDHRLDQRLERQRDELTQTFDQKLDRQRDELIQMFDQKLDRQRDQLMRHTEEISRRDSNGIVENLRSFIGALDDKYSSIPARTDAVEAAIADLSPRVAHLERKVFAPRKRSTRKRMARRRRR